LTHADKVFEDSSHRHQMTVGLLKSLKSNTEPDIAFQLASDGFNNFMIDYYTKVLEGTSEGSQERFDAFRKHYEEYAENSTYIRVQESMPSSLKVIYQRCPFAEVMEAHGLSEFTRAYCLSDEAFTKKVLPGVTFHRENLIASGDKFCDHSWTKDNK